MMLIHFCHDKPTFGICTPIFFTCKKATIQITFYIEKEKKKNWVFTLPLKQLSPSKATFFPIEHNRPNCFDAV